jgi:hypothetical protein
MQRSLIAATLSLALCSVVHAQEPAAVAARRDGNQQERIEQGLQSGQLSSKEAGQLERDEQHLDRTQARDLKSGGALTPQEKAQITRQQNAVSRDIYHDKHNGVTGNPDSASSQRLQADVQRNANQQQRITNGINNGTLTNKEAGHLEAGQARINRNEANAAANGHVGAAEQAHILGRENHQSKKIHDKKHNEKERGG